MSSMTFSELAKAIRSGGWTLFLDRDGVLNRRKMGGYIERVEEMVILPGVVECLAVLGEWMDPVVVVTNQRGIARGLMTENDLAEVHDYLKAELAAGGARLDQIYYCPHDRDSGCDCRKPGIGMALQACADFPRIDFARSLLIGDTASDLEMGRTCGMVCLHVGPEVVPDGLADFHLSGLVDLVPALDPEGTIFA